MKVIGHQAVGQDPNTRQMLKPTHRLAKKPLFLVPENIAPIHHPRYTVVVASQIIFN